MNRKSLVSAFVMLAMLAAFLGFATTPAAAAGGCTLTIPLVTTPNTPGSTVTVPIGITCDPTAPTRGYQFDLAFDASRLQELNVADGGFLTSVAGHGNLQSGNTPTIDNVGGHILGVSYILTGGDGHGPTGTGTLATVTFAVKSGAANGVAPLTLSNVIISNETGSSSYATTLNNKFVRVGPAPALTIQSITFTPSSGSSTPSVAVVLKNTGGADMTPGTDDTNVTLAMSACTPASATTLVSGVHAGATTEIDQAYTACGAVSTFTVSDTVYGLSQSVSYINSVTSSQGTTVDGSMPAMYINLSTAGAVNFGVMAYGVNVKQVGMNVTTNAPSYSVLVAMDNWHLTEWNGSAYVPVSGSHPFSLHDPLNLIVYLADGSTYLGGPATSNTPFFAGAIAGQSADAGQNFLINYAQTLHHDDATLATGFTYHGVVTYTAVASF